MIKIKKLISRFCLRSLNTYTTKKILSNEKKNLSKKKIS